MALFLTGLILCKTSDLHARAQPSASGLACRGRCMHLIMTMLAATAAVAVATSPCLASPLLEQLPQTLRFALVEKKLDVVEVLATHRRKQAQPTVPDGPEVVWSERLDLMLLSKATNPCLNVGRRGRTLLSRDGVLALRPRAKQWGRQRRSQCFRGHWSLGAVAADAQQDHGR